MFGMIFMVIAIMLIMTVISIMIIAIGTMMIMMIMTVMIIMILGLLIMKFIVVIQAQLGTWEGSIPRARTHQNFFKVHLEFEYFF